MSRTTMSVGYTLCCAVVLTASQGCSQKKYYSSTRTSQVTWRADLDDCREVRLSYDLIRDRRAPEDPACEYEQLTLEVLPREDLRLLRTLKRIALTQGALRGQLEYRDVEIRADREHRKVWFVETETSRIVATLDIETGATTGPDDTAPSWATPRGGILLEGLQ